MLAVFIFSIQLVDYHKSPDVVTANLLFFIPAGDLSGSKPIYIWSECSKWVKNKVHEPERKLVTVGGKGFIVPLSLCMSLMSLLSFYRKNASKSWHVRNLTASQIHMMMKFLPHHQTQLSRPGAAEEGSVPRSTPKRMLSATFARSALIE